MMTAAQVTADILSHAACPEGVAWAAGKTSDDIWRTADPQAVLYLFWWAAQNMGTPGWAPKDRVLVVLGEIIPIALKFVSKKESVEARVSYAATDPLRFFHYLIRQIPEEGTTRLAYYTEILPLVRTLRASL